MAMTDTVMQKLIEKEGCQWLGPDQDPRDGPTTICGHKVIPGKAYCEEHYHRVYIGGTALTKKRSASAVVKKQHSWAPGELEDLLWECYEELIAEGAIEA